MGYFPVRYDSRVVNYDHRGFIRLATECRLLKIKKLWHLLNGDKNWALSLNVLPFSGIRTQRRCNHSNMRLMGDRYARGWLGNKFWRLATVLSNLSWWPFFAISFERKSLNVIIKVTPFCICDDDLKRQMAFYLFSERAFISVPRMTNGKNKNLKKIGFTRFGKVEKRTCRFIR